MASKPEWRLRFISKGKPIFGFFGKKIRDGLILKQSVPEIGKHFHIFSREDKIGHLVTHEKYPPGHWRRHTQKGEITIDELISILLIAISPPDDCPPPVKSIAELSDDSELLAWFERILPKIVHPPSDELVIIFKGIVGQILDAITQLEEGGADIDVTNIIENPESLENIKKEDIIETVTQSQLNLPDKRFGFSIDFKTIVFLIEPGLVLELYSESIAEASEILTERLGLNGFFRTISRK
jgi:hypothetical protein